MQQDKSLTERSLRVAITGVVPADDPTIIADMQAEIERLRAALKRYGLHEWDCPRNDVPEATECTCGLDAVEQKSYE